ncbi:hypothetical protein [Sphingobacterium tabacisoli]|uniref:Uncharacterized protein n=1 Tax=Sphingobacterium tabacisoli TaxID=2044855 RepID=A0ABW5L1R6_9SPHI|nr:hypothetical protein [Sphingobacterium tabacisoli]
MDIVQHITAHTERLRLGIPYASAKQLRDLKIAGLKFFFLLPDFVRIVQQYIPIAVKQEELIEDIVNGRLQQYQQAIERSNKEVDVYADDYEELEQLELFVLNAFEYATSADEANAVIGLLLEIIDTLDYYENFSDNPLYWNKLLEEELVFQNELLKQLKANKDLQTDSYRIRYQDVPLDSC